MDDIQEKDYYFHIDATMERPPLPVLIPVDVFIHLQEVERDTKDILHSSP